MANVLNIDKQIMIVGALAEGSSIRSIERMSGVHPNTIMRLGVKARQGCTALMDEKMRDLPCTRLEMDEIWGFVGKKEKHVKEGEDGVGSVWTFCAIDADTKLVPAFKVGNRDTQTANAFVKDVASRMRLRVQVSTDGLRAYVEATEGPLAGMWTTPRSSRLTSVRKPARIAGTGPRVCLFGEGLHLGSPEHGPRIYQLC
jgi:IS1 family transposase